MGLKRFMSLSRRGSDASNNLSDEETPLIRKSDASNFPLASKDDGNSATFIKLYILCFVVNVAFTILSPAQTRIFEQIYCDDYYRQHPTIGFPPDSGIPEQLCKIGAVQKQVSTLKGWFEFYNAIPSLFMTIPIGILADIFGRRKFLIVNLFTLSIQMVCVTVVTLFPETIPLRTIWFQAFLSFVSGGPIVAEMLFVCVITDLSTGNKLSNTLFRLSATSQLTRVVGPTLAGVLMRRSAWWAIWVGLTCLILSAIMTVSLPETLQHRQENIDADAEELKHETVSARLKTGATIAIKAFRELAFVWIDWRLLFNCFLLMPFRVLAEALKELLIRYASNRYGLSLADATFLYPLQAVSATIILFALLPPISDYIDNRWNISAIKKNVVFIRVALLMLVLGLTIEGLAPTVTLLVFGLIVETLGAGMPSSTRAMAGVLVEQKDNGRVFSVLAISETLSTMVAFPATNWLFNVGIDREGGIWLGMPYFVTAGAAAVAFIAMCVLSFEKRTQIP